jgi:glycosyltransferase involved in cell wall biosynthesis
MTTVSIIIINHNYARFLTAAIESALAQTTPAKEVVVVDDGSTDASADIIRGYGRRIRPVFKPAGGHVSAVNAGYPAATGDLCIFLDADDLLYDRCIETVLGAWRPGAVKLQFRLDTIDQDGADQHMPFPYFPADLTPDSVRRQALQFGVYPWTVSSGNAFSRTLLDALLPIDVKNIYRSPDGYINKLAPLFGDVESISDVLGAYRVHGANAWAQPGQGIQIEQIVRWLRFDLVLQRNFEAKAAQLGVALPGYPDIRNLQQLEYRLLAWRFARMEFDQSNSTRASLFAAGLKAIQAAPGLTWVGRGAWAGWLFVMAFMPKAMVRFIFGGGRGQARRGPLSRFLVRHSQGPSSRRLAGPASTPGAGPMRIAVVIATLGRPEEVGQLLERIALQTFPPSAVILSVESEADLPPQLPKGVRVVMGPRGSSTQRNRGMDPVLPGCDLVAFFDDDYLPSARALEGMARLFRENPDVVGATGRLLVDGIMTGGFPYDVALADITAFDAAPHEPARIERDVQGAYGCNMVFRADAIGEARFDENLPLYGWQEDVDFAARLLPSGRLVKTNAFVGIHRGVTRGRTSGVRFGFSQIVNPVYLVGKGTMGLGKAANLMARNLLANHAKALWPEPWVDRLGRVRGNWIGIGHVFSGKADPRGVLKL